MSITADTRFDEAFVASVDLHMDPEVRAYLDDAFRAKANEPFGSYAPSADSTSTYGDGTVNTVPARPRKNAPVQFPTGKHGRFSKDRRYVPSAKKSESKKIHSAQGKGAKHKKAERALNP